MIKYIHELFKRKDLILYLVVSGLKAQHRNSFLGWFWWLLDPLLGVLIYYFVVVIVFKAGGEGYGAYLVIGMVVWRWVSSTITSSSRSIVSQIGIITQVYLPKAVFPLSVAVTQLINFGFGLIIIALFFVFFHIIPGIEMLWLPFTMVIQLIFLTAIALALGYACVFIKDIDYVAGHMTRLWFYASPVIWQKDKIPEKFEWVISMNPMTYFLTSYRNIFLYHSEPEFVALSFIGLISIATVIAMIYFYMKNEHNIIKIL